MKKSSCVICGGHIKFSNNVRCCEKCGAKSPAQYVIRKDRYTKFNTEVCYVNRFRQSNNSI